MKSSPYKDRPIELGAEQPVTTEETINLYKKLKIVLIYLHHYLEAEGDPQEVKIQYHELGELKQNY